MADEYHVQVLDDEGEPIAAVSASSFVESGDEIVDKVRDAVEPERETNE